MSDVLTLAGDQDPAAALRARHGRLLLRTREARGLTQEALARMIEAEGLPITRQAIAKWEAGESSPRNHHQVAVAKALGVPHAVLFPMGDL